VTAVLGLVACSWQIGRAPSAVPAARPRLEAPAVAEPGLEDSLSRALDAATLVRLDTRDGPELLLRVERADVVGLASSGAQVQEARLDLSLSLLTEPPESARVSGVQGFAGSSPLELEAARRQAFDELSERLVEEAVEQLLVAR
jgi:hypothetical protein